MIRGSSRLATRPCGAAVVLFGAIVGTALGSAWGCQRDAGVDLSVPKRELKADQYEKVLERWTRHRRIIKHFDTNLEVHVTFLSPELVTAHAAAHARDYRLTKGEHNRFLAKRLAEVEARHEFFMAATTADTAWNDFDRSESVWRITLEDDRGTRVTPLAVTSLTATEVHRTYFPYVTVFHRIYHVLFPKQVGGRPFITPASRWFKLVIASPLGDTELAWFVQPSAKAGADPGLPRPDPNPPARPEPVEAPRRP